MMKIGQDQWRDLTVANADAVRDFYVRVIGWKAEPLDMGGYSDYVMLDPATGEGMAGVCHARGTNAGLPAQWLVYFAVEDVEASAKACIEAGGEVLDGPRPMGGGMFCVIRDPAGAVAALYRAGEGGGG